jgi:exonuclease III
MDMRFFTWNVRSLYRSGSLRTVARELGKYKLDLVDVQEVRWDKGGTERAEDYTFFYGINRASTYYISLVYDNICVILYFG